MTLDLPIGSTRCESLKRFATMMRYTYLTQSVASRHLTFKMVWDYKEQPKICDWIKHFKSDFDAVKWLEARNRQQPDELIDFGYYWRKDRLPRDLYKWFAAEFPENFNKLTNIKNDPNPSWTANQFPNLNLLANGEYFLISKLCL